MNMNHYMPTKLITGKGCVKKSAKNIAELGKKCLIITGKNSAKACGALADIQAVLQENGQKYRVFDGIGQNPKLSDCMKAAEIASEMGADFLIGIGGGSPLDAAKCTAVLSANPGMTQEQLYAFDWKKDPLKIMLIGTTAGTGSEVTKVSVITNLSGKKKSFHHEKVYPVLSFGDPAYTLTLSEQFTKSTAIDAFAHCMESYFSKAANEISQCYAVRGIRMLLNPFREMCIMGTGELSYETRELLYNASIYGGLAINITGTTFPHTMGYLLTEEFQIPHGTACAVFLPEFYEYNKKTVPELTAQFLREIGCTEIELLSLLKGITPSCEIEISEEMIVQAHSRWIGNGSIAKCQGNLEADEVDAILRRRFGAKA
ncbi:MAG: iron-containing alcohol dehydrogenase [Eubacteriales bacterium]|nr:iron-containing alcohol dehydrogenase [Eubacteriales bacterium]